MADVMIKLKNKGLDEKRLLQFGQGVFKHRRVSDREEAEPFPIKRSGNEVFAVLDRVAIQTLWAFGKITMLMHDNGEVPVPQEDYDNWKILVADLEQSRGKEPFKEYNRYQMGMNDGQLVLLFWLLGLAENPETQVGEMGFTANKYVLEKRQLRGE